jgi:RNA polymerase sigma factor (sigma-70 family)
MTDELAMIAVSAGDLDKAAVLYERYKRPMFNFYLRYGIGRDHAQDLTQQVFYRLIHYKHTYQTGHEFRTWIYRIARNIYHDFLKDNHNKMNELDANIDLADEVNFDDEQHQILKKALEELPNEYREVLMMSRYEELKYEEIAEILNITVSLVKVRVHRGLKQLREIYFQLAE